MSTKEIVSALKYVSGFKKSFMLSELQQYVKEEPTTAQIHKTVAPLLDGLGLRAVPVDGDYRIERLPPAVKLELSEEEQKRQEAFFATPRVPVELEQLIEKYVEKKASRPADDPIVLEKIRKAVVSQKAQYWKIGQKRKIDYRSGFSVLGYLAYQFPVYFVQFEHVLQDMAQDGLLKRRMRVLDVGAGPGSVSLAVIDFFRRLDDCAVDLFALEKYEENSEAYVNLVNPFAGLPDRFKVEKPIRADLAEKPALPDNLDLIVFSNVLNEINVDREKKAEIVMHCVKSLAPDGNLVIIEPADKDNSTELRLLVSTLMDKGLGAYSPCSFMWGSRCKLGECWSFEEKEHIAPTALMEKVAATEEPYRFINTDIKYSHAILRKDALTRSKYRVPPKAKVDRLSKLKIHVKNRINVVAAKMSDDLGDKKNHMFKICDGTTAQPVYAVLPNYNIVPGNELLMKAKYGEALEFRNILVRYNEEYDSYNLMVGKSTEIALAGQPALPDSCS
ncbi:MAG TPA: small ribosomal subunit Rsm22 family protein [Methanocella sp.]